MSTFWRKFATFIQCDFTTRKTIHWGCRQIIHYKKGPERYDSWCKACKRLKRKSVYRKIVDAVKPKQSTTAKPTLPEVNSEYEKHLQEEIDSKTEKEGDREHIEPREENFEIWEKLYGKPLSKEDRMEIKMNLKEFFQLLLEEAHFQRIKIYGV